MTRTQSQFSHLQITDPSLLDGWTESVEDRSEERGSTVPEK